MSEASTETEKMPTPTSTTTIKPRTPAQMEALQRARVKALEVRQRNKELRDKQKEIDRIAVEQTKKQTGRGVLTDEKQEAIEQAQRLRLESSQLFEGPIPIFLPLLIPDCVPRGRHSGPPILVHKNSIN